MQFKACLILILSALQLSLWSQSVPYVKSIKDSSNSALFGLIGYIGVDSTNIHLIYNSGFNIGGYCTSANGSIYYSKLNKQSGNVIVSKKISGLYPSRLGTAILHHGFLYMGGEIGSYLFTTRSFIFKFNTQTYSFNWQRVFCTTTWIPANSLGLPFSAIVRRLGFNPSKDKLVFFGNGNCYRSGVPYNFALGSMRGIIDTNNVTFQVNAYGNSIADTLYEHEPSYVIARGGTKAFGLRSNNTTQAVSLVINPNYNQLINAESTIKLNSITSGHHYIEYIGSKFLNAIDENSGTLLLVSDTTGSILYTKQLTGIHVRSLDPQNEKANLIFTNDLGNGKADLIISIKVDSALNILATKKMFIDTFQISDFNCKSTSDLNFNYVLFNKRNENSSFITLYKFNYSLYNCNESVFNPIVSNPSITFTNSAKSTTPSAVSQFTANPQTVSFPIRDSGFCYSGQSPAPEINFLIQNICVGSPTTFTNLTTNNPVYWQWKMPGSSSPTSGLFQPTVSYNMPGVYNITLTAQNPFGSTMAVKTITVYPLPLIVLNSGSVCPGATFTINPAGAQTYTFLNGGPYVSPQAPTVYSVTGTDSNGCVSSSPSTSSVSIFNTPNLSVVSNKTLVCVGESVTLTASGANTYTWSNNFVGNPNVIVILSNTTISLSGADFNTCIDSSSIFIKASGCANNIEIVRADNFLYFPVPSTDFLHLLSNSDHDISILSAEVCNSLGQHIQRYEYSNNESEFLIPVYDLPEGIYILRISSNQGTLRNLKFTVSHN